jgi:hypothetical protein
MATTRSEYKGPIPHSSCHACYGLTSEHAAHAGMKSTIAKVKKCAGCHLSWYCSVECQRKVWPQHKSFCIQVQNHLEDLRVAYTGAKQKIAEGQEAPELIQQLTKARNELWKLVAHSGGQFIDISDFPDLLYYAFGKNRTIYQEIYELELRVHQRPS